MDAHPDAPAELASRLEASSPPGRTQKRGETEGLTQSLKTTTADSTPIGPDRLQPRCIAVKMNACARQHTGKVKALADGSEELV
jgi:hypothetical protein